MVGAPAYPYFAAKTGAFFFFTFAAVALAATFAQINPIWLYGPYNPVGISAGSQPDFYMGFLEGSLRMMPAWQWVVFGHTFAFNVFIPALLPLGLIMTGAALWPFLEQWVTGDRREHHLNDRPRNAPTRTAIGMTTVAFYGVLWAEGANDVIADHLDIPLYTITWIARFSIFLVPWITYVVTKRICLGLQRADLHTLEHGVETGIIRQLPTGEFIEVTEAPSEEELAVLTSRPDYLPLPGRRGVGRGRARARHARRRRPGARADVQRAHRERAADRRPHQRARQRPRHRGAATGTGTATPRPRCPPALARARASSTARPARPRRARASTNRGTASNRRAMLTAPELRSGAVSVLLALRPAARERPLRGRQRVSVTARVGPAVTASCRGRRSRPRSP